VGLATARVLATLGVSTTVYCPKQEIHLCAVEESLYQLGGGVVHRQWPEESKTYDVVVHSLDDHVSTISGGHYGCKKIVLVDPPLADYTTSFHAGTKVHVVCPALPLAYRDVKVFLVNLSIPSGLFEQNSVKYQSPFGNRLIVQLF
jgi:predicted membrane chloride channel (bestrophin family)